MLSQIREHVDTLQESERFYYNNYEYFNTYEDPKEYQKDLSKLRFNLLRKNRAAIVLYDTHSSNYESPPQDRLIRQHCPRPTAHDASISENYTHQTLDDLLYVFAQSFHENNYSDLRPDRQQFKDCFDVLIFKYMIQFLEKIFRQEEIKDFEVMRGVIETLIQVGRQTREKLEQLYEREGKIQTPEFMERWYAFQQYWDFLLQVKIQAENKNQKIENFYLFQCCQFFKYILSQVSLSHTRSYLLLSQPFTPLLNHIVHPLTIPLIFANKQKTLPKCLFLNLDGRETYLNLRTVKQLTENMRYISIFREPLGSQITDFKLEKNCDQFQIDADYINMNKAHSELLFREIHSCDADKQQFSQNIILYPLNSLYLRRKYSMKHFGENVQNRRLPLMNDSGDIRWLWDEVISGQVEEWGPQLVIVSYNGLLDIAEEDFKAIMKDLTILCDHRMILFTNMTGLFQMPQDDMDQQLDGEWSMNKIGVVQDFIDKYVPYDYTLINEERYFANLSYFVKISSGSMALRNTQRNAPTSRYLLGQRLLYIERLSQLQEYKGILSQGNQGHQIGTIFKEFATRELKQNRKENQLFQKRILEIEQQLLKYEAESPQLQQYETEQQRLFRHRQRQISFRIHTLKQQLQVQELLVHEEQSGMEVQTDYADYLRKGRQRLLLENLQSYRYRRMYAGQEEDRNGYVSCFRFCLGENERQEISLEKYSQVITDDKRHRVFIVNYRIAEDKHVILQGEMVDRESFITMKRVQTVLEESLQELTLQNSQMLYINFSHCFMKQKLYLFWPQEWDLKQQIRRRLLQMDYSPPHINYCLRLFYNSNDKSFSVEKLQWLEKNTFEVIPRRGCVGLQSDKGFYILGGIFDSRLDFYNTKPAISIAIINDKKIQVQALPKRKDQNKILNLKPKMHYRVERSIRTNEDGSGIILSGGYGRAFTNFHTLFSYQNYSLTVEYNNELKINKSEMKNGRLVRLEKPLTAASIGRFLVGGQGQTEQRFSERVKDWILVDSREGDHEVISILEQEMRVREFRNDHKRNYLFGWDRTIREKIYIPHCWSPELQIIVEGRLFLVYAGLKVEKSSSYNIGNFLIPKEQDMVSLCLDQDRILMLAKMDILLSTDNRSSYILCEGSLANMNDVLSRRELSMQQRFEFRWSNQHQTPKFKTIFILDEKIFIIGGLSKQAGTASQRQDYILERNKDRLKKKIRKLECNSDNLEMTSPVVVKHQNGYLLYSIISKQCLVQKSNNQQCTEQFWRLKIQTFTPNDNCQEESMISGPLQLYHIDFEQACIVRRKPAFNDPKIVKIIPYVRFSTGMLRELIEKIYIKVSKIEDQLKQYDQYLQLLRIFLRQRNQAKIAQLLHQHHHNGNTFKNFFGMFDFLLDGDKKDREDLEDEQLVRDIRNLYSLMNKHLLECLFKIYPEDTVLYRFIIEDRTSRKVKYIAIGPLLTTQLRFLRIRYKHELSICLNQANEEELFFNTNILSCEEIAKERLKGATVDLEEEEQNHKIIVSFKT